MKILSIHLKNLASLAGEHLIDFESEPLASAGLIAIVGKTGAGKSTLLDAMCLALFNKVPRLKEGDGKLIDADGSELAANASQTVLRRGCAHGFAELSFVAQDQKRYLARWELKRARENPNGKLQNVQRYLKCLDDGVVIADKTKAVEENIKKITQLSFEQFTRAVLLAQSEVTAFLKARDAERGELLEYLTNSNIFGKIGELAYKKTSEINKQRKQLEEVLGHIDLLSDEAHAELEQQLAQCNAERQAQNQLQQQQQQQQRWFQQQDQLKSQIVEQQQRHQVQDDALRQMQPQRLALQRLELFSSIRTTYQQLQHHQRTAHTLAIEQQSKQQHFILQKQKFEQDKKLFIALEQQLHQQQDFEQQHQIALKQLNALIEQRRFILEDYALCRQKRDTHALQAVPLIQQQQQHQQETEQQQQRQQQCIQQLEQTQQYSTLDLGLSTYIQQLQKFIPAYQQLEAQLGHIPQARAQYQQALQHFDAVQKQYGDVTQLERDLERMQSQHAAQALGLNRFQQLQQQFDRFTDIQSQVRQLGQSLEQLKAERETLERTCPDAEQRYLAAQLETRQLNQILQQQRLLHTENIEKLRAELKENQACLVCGSLAHPYREDHTALSKSLFELQQQQLNQAEAQQKIHFQAWQDQRHAQTQCDSRLESIQKQYQQQSDLHQHSASALSQALQQFELVVDLKAEFKHIKAQLDQHEQQLHSSQRDLEQQKLESSQQLKQQRESALRLQQQQQGLNQAAQLEQQFEDLIALAQSDTSLNLSAAADAMLVQLQQRDAGLQQLKQIQSSLDQRLLQAQALDAQLLNHQHNQNNIQQEFERLEKLGKETNQKAIYLIHAMTGEEVVKANEWVEAYQHKNHQLQQQYRTSRAQFDTQQNEFLDQEKALTQLQLQAEQAKQLCRDTETLITAWLAQHPSFTEDCLEQLLNTPAEQEKIIRQTIQDQEGLVNDAAAALKAINAQLHSHLAQQPDIDRATLEQNILSSEAALEQLNAKRDQLKLSLELHQQSLQKQQQFMAQIQEIQQQEQRWAKISGLMGDATGKKFRDIAQQYHLDILVEYANQQLSQLSQRYTLKRLDNSLSLAIIDHDMDGETRSVASLSGGESFLTALALSLAIANMASGSMKIESLFIDEGFGTLDASSLHMVMNALDQLQSQGRKVVLISHIPDMHERIPVQIQVKARGAGASSIEVVA